MKKRGFTIIELLAVIIILAVVALIMTPIVANIIKDAKVGAVERSAEIYVDNARTAIAAARIDGTIVEEGEYLIQEDGSICPKEGGCEKNKIVVEMLGDIPTEGTLFVEKETVLNYRNIKFTDGYASLGEKGALGSETPTPICTAVKKATRGNVPKGEYANGDEYKCEVKRGVTYTFYVVGVSGDKVSLIMDKNITEKGEPASDNGYYTFWYAPSNTNANGPVTAMTFLHEATKDWNYLENLVMNYKDEGYNATTGGPDTTATKKTYGYKSITTTGNVTSIIRNDGNISATFTNLKARLPMLVEMTNAGCATKGYSGSNNNCASWVNDGSISFLISSAPGGNMHRATYLFGNFNGSIPDLKRGVRPVITVSKQYIK